MSPHDTAIHRLPWHPSAPAGIRHAEPAAAWPRWVEHLAARTPSRSLAQIVGSTGTPLNWALAGGQALTTSLARAIDAGPLSPRLAGELERRLAQGDPRERDQRGQFHFFGLLPQKSGQSPGDGPDADGALELLAWSHLLPRLAAILPEARWWQLLAGLCAAARTAVKRAPRQDPLVQQLLGAELPLTLAYLLPEVGPCRALEAAGRKQFARGLGQWLHGEGLPHAAQWSLLLPLLACWTRCLALGSGGRPGRCGLGARALRQYRLLVRNALRLVPAPGTRGRRFDWLHTAARLAEGPVERRVAAAVLASPGKPPRLAAVPSSTYSEAAAAAILRTTWSADSQQVTATWADALELEVRSGRQPVLAGPWSLELRLDGRPAPQVGPWDPLCWCSDGDADYLELQARLQGGCRVQRHMLLAREDGFLWLADSILSDRPASIEYRACLGLPAGVRAEGGVETWEHALRTARSATSVARILPLALPEWRAAPHAGCLAAVAEGLELRQAGRGRGLFATLFVDLDPRRRRRPLTWRQLAVAEDRRRVSDDVAVGYRVQIGRQQWLFYRALARCGNRTVLGANTSNEMLAARFVEGEARTLLEIEGAGGGR